MYGKVKTTVIGTGKFEIEIDKEEAFRLLCDAIDMSFFYKDDFDDYFILVDEDDEYDYIYKRVEDESEITEEDEKEDEYGFKRVLTFREDKYKCFDDRGRTFLALYNLASESIFMGMDGIVIKHHSDFK